MWPYTAHSSAPTLSRTEPSERTMLTDFKEEPRIGTIGDELKPHP